jgi:protein-disulfide isomerase
VATATQPTGKNRDRTALILGCALIAVAGVELARMASAPKAKPAATAAPEASADPLDDGFRYQVPVSMTQPARGPKEAPVTVVMWGDLGEADRKVDPVLNELQQRYGDKLRLVYRHHLAKEQAARISVHEIARMANERTGKFWELRAELIKNPIATPTEADLQRYATVAGLDWPATKTALDSHAFQRHIAADGVFGGMFGVTEAPAFFVNGRRFMGQPSAPRLENLIDRELAYAQQVLARGVAPAALYTELTKDALWKVGQDSSIDPQAARGSNP